MQKSQWWGILNVPENNSYMLNSATFILAVEHKAKEWCIHVKRNSESNVEENDKIITDMIEEEFTYQWVGHH